MARVPRKNISKKIADIRPPNAAGGGVPATPERPIEMERAREWRPVADPALNRSPSRPPGHFPVGRFIGAFLILAALVAGGVGAAAYRYREESILAASRTVEILYRSIRGGGDERAAGTAGERVGGGVSLDDLFAALRDVGSGFLDLQEFSSQAAIVAESGVRTLQDIPDWLSGGDGTALAGNLSRVRDALGNVQNLASRLTAHPSLVSALPFDGGESVEIAAHVSRGKQFLDAFIPWFTGSDPQYVLVLLENPAELRPGGGFVGSFAVITIRDGRVAAVEVHDVNDADRTLGAKIVPPRPLQTVATRWRAADANWFFDFPKSAAKVAEFIERSALFRDRNVRFGLVAGIAPRAIEDILARTGPVTLPSGETFSANDFLERIQGSVQASQAAGGAYPKDILRALAPLLLEKLSALPAEDRVTLAEEARSWIVRRDVRLFSSVPAFGQFFDGIGASGRAFVPPERFAGDYLAVAHANIGGEKSDLRMANTVTAEIQLAEEGTVSHRVTIERKHRATAKDPWWYRATNQNYLQLMTSPSAKLAYADGGEARTMTPKANYATGGYERDPLVVAEEKGLADHAEYPAVRVRDGGGARIFSTWVSTAAGKTSAATFHYTTRLPESLRDGSTYTFVFERQSGAGGKYRFEINAPIGFVFRENNLPAYIYETDDAPGRITIDLTLAPIDL